MTKDERGVRDGASSKLRLLPHEDEWSRLLSQAQSYIDSVSTETEFIEIIGPSVPAIVATLGDAARCSQSRTT